MKACTKCGVEKPLEDFYKDVRSAKRRRGDGRLPTCKTCKLAANKKWQADNAERFEALKARWNVENKAHKLEINALWRANNRARASRTERASRMVRLYGLTPAQLDELFAMQGRRCAICRSEDPRNKYGWHNDHDHITKRFRGILCARCNHLLGHAGDSTETLGAAIEYLKRNA